MADSEEKEWQTRKRRIDVRLSALGWVVVPFDETKPLESYIRHAVTELLLCPGINTIQGELLLDALSRWAQHQVSFADAVLAARSSADGHGVCSVNAKDFLVRGVAVTQP